MSDCNRTERELVDYLDGTLAAPERAALEAHAAQCRACSTVLVESRAVLEAYRAVPDEDVSAELAAQLSAAARERTSSAPRARRIPWRLVAVAAALAIALACLWLGRRSSDPLDVLLREGRAELAAGRKEDALATYERALPLAGTDERVAEVLYRLAQVHVVQQAFPQALERIDRALALPGNHAELEELLFLRGQVLEALGKQEEALACYQRLVAEFPGASEKASERIRTLTDFDPLQALQGLGYGGGD